jgi:hypothetical protein
MPQRKPAGRPREPRRLSRAWFAAVLAGVFFVLSFVGILRHEPWRDELQAWMVARDAHSLPELFQNVKYEGNPALWHLVLFAVTRVSGDPLAMAVVHILISTIVIAVFARYIDWPSLPKVLFAFGYAAFFEFNLISRGYALGLLFLMVFCALYPHRDRRLFQCALMLALMANTSPFGLMLSSALGAHMILDHLARLGRTASYRRVAAAAGLLLAGWILSVVQIYPEADNTFPVAYAEGGFALRRLGFALSRILTSYLPLPDFSQPHFWNHTLFATWTPLSQVALSLALFLVFTAGFLRKRRLALLYVGGTVLMVAFVYQTQLAFQRYTLHLFILLVTCFCLEPHTEDDLRTPWLCRVSDRVRPWAGRLFVALLAGGVYAGAGAYLQDLARPFSTSGEAAAFLRAKGVADLEIVGYTDYIVSPLAALLEKRIYYPERADYGRFIVWNRDRKHDADLDAVRKAAAFMLAKGEKRFLWIADTQPSRTRGDEVQWYEGGDGLIPDAHVTLLGKIPPGITDDEHYVIYLVERAAGPAR